MSLLTQSFIFLVAAVISVPLSKRLGLGSVLGYLAAGIAIGPWGLGLFRDADNILHFAEFGVVLLLFVIGLELQPKRLWLMRKAVFGQGTAQVLVSAAAFGAIAFALGESVPAAVIIGVALALSSTAFALQILAEKNQLTSRHGRTAFAILLFQDLAAIPVLALIPVMAAGEAGPVSGTGLSEVLYVLGILVAVAVGGRFLLRYVFRVVAGTGIPEVFTALTLLTVVAAAQLMDFVGLSMALGAFFAGILLAESEYRHELHADIEPFKGLLLGLFFIAVGMSLNVGLIAVEPATILAGVVALVMIKALLLFGLGRFSGLGVAPSRTLAIAISQGGEFAFVILTVTVEAALIDQGTADYLVAVVTLSMAVTPLLFLLDERVITPWLAKPAVRPFDVIPEQDNCVIIAGFGRFGQIVGRILRAKRIPFTALEASPDQVDFVRRFGSKVFYGDASRIDLLRSANADKAKVFVLAIDDMDASVRTAETVVRNFPHLKIFARARNRQHAYRLMDLGIRVVWRETFFSSLNMAEQVLLGLGFGPLEAARTVETFRRHDESRLYALAGQNRDEKRLQQLAKKAAEELEELFAADNGTSEDDAPEPAADNPGTAAPDADPAAGDAPAAGTPAARLTSRRGSRESR